MMHIGMPIKDYKGGNGKFLFVWEMRLPEVTQNTIYADSIS